MDDVIQNEYTIWQGNGPINESHNKQTENKYYTYMKEDCKQISYFTISYRDFNHKKTTYFAVICKMIVLNDGCIDILFSGMRSITQVSS